MKTYKDIYHFPLIKREISTWVVDSKDQFVFQFEIHNKVIEDQIMDVLNGKREPLRKCNFIHDKGYISENGTNIILIRGWGNLTGIGGHNLQDNEAANIQNTFAEFIVNRLNSFK